MKGWINRMDAWLDSTGEKLSGRNIQYPADLITGIVGVIFAVFILAVMPQQVAISEKEAVNGREFPTLLMYMLIAASIILIVKEIYKIVTKKPMQMKTMNLLVEVKALIVMVILLASYFIAKSTDLFVLGAVFCALGFMIFFRCKKAGYYGITLAAAVVIWAVFRFVLNVSF